jgi:hypothetical protein
MKFLILAALLTSQTSFAAVVDQFTCKLTYEDITGQNRFETTADLSAIRLPLSSSPAPDIRMTSGRTGLISTKSNDHAAIGVDITYDHAVKVNSAGQPIMAAQRTCIRQSICTPAEPDNDGDGISTSGCTMTACLQQPTDPFDPQYAWPRVPLASDGIPQFDARAIQDVVYYSPFYGTLRATCNFIGTVR